jgi:hypothetical protein
MRNSAMRSQQVPQFVIAVILVIPFLAGCGSSTSAVISEVLTAPPEPKPTTTSEPPTATLEPLPALSTPEPSTTHTTILVPASVTAAQKEPDSLTSEAVDTPAPTNTPVPTDTPLPTNIPLPTDTPEPTATATEVPLEQQSIAIQATDELATALTSAGKATTGKEILHQGFSYERINGVEFALTQDGYPLLARQEGGEWQVNVINAELATVAIQLGSIYDSHNNQWATKITLSPNTGLWPFLREG